MVTIFENKEINDIVISAIALAVAFAIAFNGGIVNIFSFSFDLVVIAFVAVSISFILHELAHRFLARHYGFYAEYKMWPQGLGLALLFSLFGFVFAAPGAVMIHPKADLWGTSRTLTQKKIGLIALVGPLTNVALAAVFLAAFFFVSQSVVFAFAISINIWLALFNMIPVWNLDGAKVLWWDKKIYGVVVAIALMFLFLQNFISIA